MAEIQKNIIEWGRRNALSRMFHAKNDKGTIATWRVGLNTILHVFNVCGITLGRLPLTADFQTELAINTNVAISDVHHDVLNTSVAVSDVNRNVLNTKAIVSDIHRTIVESQESQDGTDGKNQPVSATLLLRSFRINAHHYSE